MSPLSKKPRPFRTEAELDGVIHARWDDAPEETQGQIQVTGGQAVVTISGGERIRIGDLPVGTHYALVEQEAGGWTQSESSDLEGTIPAVQP